MVGFLRIVLTGDKKVDSRVVSGTRVFVQRFEKALSKAAEKENLTVNFAGNKKTRAINRALDLIRLSMHASIIHCLTSGKDAELAFFCSRLSHAKLILSVHGHLAQEKAGFRFPRKFRRRMYTYNAIMKRADAIIFPSELLKLQVIEEVKLDQNKIYVIPNGIDQELIVPEPRRKLISNQIGIFAKWSEIKGINRLPVLLCVAQKLGLKIRWIGANPYPQLTNPFLSVEPPVSPEEVPHLLDECLLVVVPSITESFSQVALEAMARGVPVVVSKDIGIAPLVQNYQAGQIVNFEDPSTLLEAIQHIMEEYEYYSQNALLCAKDHTWEKIIMKYVSVYRAITLS